MRKQTFDRIKKTLGILLAVFLVVTLTAASASACSTKNVKNKLASDIGDNKLAENQKNVKNNLASDIGDNKLTEKQNTELGNRLLDFADNNMFGNGWGNNWDNNGTTTVATTVAITVTTTIIGIERLIREL